MDPDPAEKRIPPDAEGFPTTLVLSIGLGIIGLFLIGLSLFIQSKYAI